MTAFRVVYAWKRHEYAALVGDALIVEAGSEAGAKRIARKMLQDMYPWDKTWRVLYAHQPITSGGLGRDDKR